MMKKLTVLIFVALIVLTACQSNGNNAKVNTSYAVGTYATTIPMSNTDKVDQEEAIFNTILATVIVNQDQEIVNLNIDVAETSIAMDADAPDKIILPAETVTRKERKDAYGLKAESDIQKEWYQQIEALEGALIGRTIEEVKNFDLKEDGTVANVDLASSVSIRVSEFVEIVSKAMEVTQEVTGEVTKIGSAVITHTSNNSTDNEEFEGEVAVESYIAHIVSDQDKKLLQVFVDVARNTLTYDQEGNWGTFTPTATYKVQRDELDMLEESSIDKEWYQQVEFLEDYLSGTTTTELNDIQLDEEGRPTSLDLVSDVTISINEIRQVIRKAIQNAVELRQN